MGSLLVYAIVLLAIPLGSRAEQLSSKECESLGFTGLALCSDCNTFAEYVKNQGITISLIIMQSYFFFLILCKKISARVWVLGGVLLISLFIYLKNCKKISVRIWVLGGVPCDLIEFDAVNLTEIG